jgi:formylglycine-generating enzyme required for sulfatase activity
MTVQFKAPPIPTMITVQGGALPEGSALAGTVVPTFHIGKYEVMWGEWKEVRDWAVTNGYAGLAGVGRAQTDLHPVADVAWWEAVWWCNAKSEKEGLSPVFLLGGEVYRPGQFYYNVALSNSPSANGYRLPLDAEWEWAARGAVKSKGYVFSGSNEINDVVPMWSPVEVGSKLPNELGIHDMSGNVQEFGWEFFNTEYDPVGRRIHNGFSTLTDMRRWTWRGPAFWDRPIIRNITIGFRLARNAP